MDRVPRTFCITLRETPKRQEAAQKYFKEINWPVEFFKGIHGESFGLKSTIPNYNKLPGREYFITQGAIGCLLSHLMLWNVLIYQPEDEFLILEDDIKLADDFSDRYKKFRKELPDDWQIVYLGHLIPGGLKEKGIIHISENVMVCKPMCTHAYMVKKSALKILIETNQLAWSPLDIQIIERSLPKLKHYAVKDPLITQQSVLNIKDETWYSLCYDWDLNPEWVTDKSNNIRLGSGWHPLEKNDDGYMIWTDGRGEFLFDDKWQKMDFEFIAEGEIEKKIRIVCPQHPDQIIDLPQYGKNNVSVSIQGAKSVILVSDTFRPIDIFKTSDSRRLGLRLLKGITLTDSEGKSTFVSLYSMYGAKKIDEMSNIKGIKMAKIRYSHEDGKINLRGQYSYNHHRSGWGFVLDLLANYHREDSTVMDSWIERTFAWDKIKNSQLRLIPYREPWVGIFHHPPNMPTWFSDLATPYAIINSREFQDSLPMCKGLYTLSKYHADFVKCFIKNIPVEVLYHPTEIPQVKFNFKDFTTNTNKKIINIGYWLRKLISIYQLDTDQGIYQKIRLLPSSSWVSSDVIERIIDIETKFCKRTLTDNMKRSVIDVQHMSNEDYDELLSKNIVFVDLYDSSANNCIIECIVRGTPILVNPLPAVVEYLGVNYPFYFSNLEEAANKLRNFELIEFTSNYLMQPEIFEKVTAEYFLKTIRESQAWKSL